MKRDWFSTLVITVEMLPACTDLIETVRELLTYP
jgi:hypothetical protein